MRRHLTIILAIVRKDLLGLLPLVLLAATVFLLQALVAGLDASATGDLALLTTVQTNIYWLSYALASLLLISALQQDPASSLSHDWLTRPVPRGDWLLARLLFLLVAIVLPVVLGRLLLFLSQGHGLWQSLALAGAVEKLPATLAVPLIGAVALLAPTLRRTLVLGVAILFVFLLPAWSATRPLLAMAGIDLGQEFYGVMWLQGVPLFCAGLLGAGGVFWWLYVRHSARGAAAALAASVVLSFLSMYPPAWLLDWDRAVAIHRSLINTADATLEQAVHLELAQACMPATPVDGPWAAGPGASLLQQALWTQAELRAAGPGALTFSSRVRARDILAQWLPSTLTGSDVRVDWRVDRIRAQALLVADSLPEPVPLRRSLTAVNRFAPSAAVETDYWLIPGELAPLLTGDAPAQLHFTFDVALLAPQPHELPVDNRLHELPGLGNCRARHDESANAIDIECLQRGPHPDLLSAELIGVRSSRVDNDYRANLTPGWLQALGMRRSRLRLEQASLVDHSAVLLSAYTAQRVSTRTLVAAQHDASGTLCPLPDPADTPALEGSRWRDSAAHETSAVTVEPGVRVEVLDWRGSAPADAPTLLLLPGLGATAHSYDALAARLSRDYAVIAMTRRGTGASSQPDRGYDTERLSQDVIQVLDTLGIDKAFVAGHSIAGEELSHLGAHHADRVHGLIYLDAAYDRVEFLRTGDRQRLHALSAHLPSAPSPLPSDLRSYAAMQQFMQRSRGNTALPPEGEIIASYDLATGAIAHDMRYLEAIERGLQAPDYPRIAVPVLALYAMPGSAQALMEGWYPQDDASLRQRVDALYAQERARKLADMARVEVEVPDAEVVSITDADHWIFVSHEQAVLEAIQAFLARVRL